MLNLAMKKITIITNTADETLKVGYMLGSNLKGGEIIQLISDLGGGKTTLTKGIVKGAGSYDTVASPTFTIKKEYHSSNLTIHHFDFYRLDNPGIVGYELQEYLSRDSDIIIIEWGDIIKDVLPKDTILIDINYLENQARQLTITVPNSKKNILKGLS
jgi:tRNA threonylcarbamoyladenosine biosynthesis protein TsaE